MVEAITPITTALTLMATASAISVIPTTTMTAHSIDQTVTTTTPIYAPTRTSMAATTALVEVMTPTMTDQI